MKTKFILAAALIASVPAVAIGTAQAQAPAYGKFIPALVDQPYKTTAANGVVTYTLTMTSQYFGPVMMFEVDNTSDRMLTVTIAGAPKLTCNGSSFPIVIKREQYYWCQFAGYNFPQNKPTTVTVKLTK